MDGGLAQQHDSGARRPRAQVAREAAANAQARLEHSSRAGDGDGTAPPAEAPDEGQGQLCELLAGLLAQLAGHGIALARRFEHKREERRDLARSQRPQEYVGHISKPERAAYFRVEPRVRATTIEGAQSRRDGLSPEVISRARVVKESSPAARAQGAAVLVATVGDAPRPRNNYDPR